MVGSAFGGGFGGWEREFGEACKIEVCLETLLELDFYTKHLNFGVDAHVEAPL
jgi:hypothetical protein